MTIKIDKEYSKNWFIQLPFKENIIVNIVWIIILIFLIFTGISSFSKKYKLLHFSFFVLTITLFILYANIIYTQRISNVMFISYPNDKKEIRNSIEDFITDGTITNPSVVPYDSSTTYVYLKKNILTILADKKKVKKKSVLRNELEILFNKYPYLPVALIKNDTLKSLEDGDFIQMKSASKS
jgi:hypothetical protein